LFGLYFDNLVAKKIPFMKKDTETTTHSNDTTEANDATMSENQAATSPDTKKAGENKKSGGRFKRKEKEIDIVKAENAELKDKYIRLQAEFDNFRKRALKEKIDMMKTAGEDLLVKMLPVLDDFDRAMQHIEKAETVDGLKEGVGLIAGKMRDFMRQNGVTEIEAKGEVFDTDLHEAVTQFPAPAEDMKGKVIDVAEKGYKLHDKVIRFSKVIVGV